MSTKITEIRKSMSAIKTPEDFERFRESAISERKTGPRSIVALGVYEGLLEIGEPAQALVDLFPDYGGMELIRSVPRKYGDRLIMIRFDEKLSDRLYYSVKRAEVSIHRPEELDIGPVINFHREPHQLTIPTGFTRYAKMLLEIYEKAENTQACIKRRKQGIDLQNYLIYTFP